MEKPGEKLPQKLAKQSTVNAHSELRDGRSEMKANPIAQTKQPKKTNKTPSPQKTYTKPINESGYKINPILIESQRQMETELAQRRRGESFTIDTNPLGLNYRGYQQLNKTTSGEYRGETRKITETRNGHEGNPRKENESSGKTSRNESSNVLIVRQPSNAGYVRRKPQEREEMVHNVELHEVQEVPYTDLRANLRRTGQIEEGSGLHRVELARQHSQRIIDVQ